jgi:hypothetical protein
MAELWLNYREGEGEYIESGISCPLPNLCDIAWIV